MSTQTQQQRPRQERARRLLLTGVVLTATLAVIAGFLTFALPQPSEAERLTCAIGDGAACQTIANMATMHLLTGAVAVVSTLVAALYSVAAILAS